MVKNSRRRCLPRNRRPHRLPRSPRTRPPRQRSGRYPRTRGCGTKVSPAVPPWATRPRQGCRRPTFRRSPPLPSPRGPTFPRGDPDPGSPVFRHRAVRAALRRPHPFRASGSRPAGSPPPRRVPRPGGPRLRLFPARRRQEVRRGEPPDRREGRSALSPCLPEAIDPSFRHPCIPGGRRGSGPARYVSFERGPG